MPACTWKTRTAIAVDVSWEARWGAARLPRSNTRSSCAKASKRYDQRWPWRCSAGRRRATSPSSSGSRDPRAPTPTAAARGQSPLIFGALDVIRAMSTRNEEPARACRPFDRDRDGFVMAEGAAVLVLESLDHAMRRDAPIYGEILGYGTTNDAYHMTAPLPSGGQPARAMRLALREADRTVEQVGYSNAHASSPPLNDTVETKAIKTVFE